MKPFQLVVIVLGLVSAAGPLHAETYRFAPTFFPITYSARHTPVLRIKSGDRVVTSVLDDLGTDASGKPIAPGPNPQTGPFFIDGAEPGDLLVITIDKLEPNRTTGTSAALMAPNAVAPGSISRRGDTRVPWTIDTAKRVVRFDLASLGRAGGASRFESAVFEMPLTPTLASIGVAPAGDDGAGTLTLGPFGGNMLAGGVAAGARVMLPVFHSGALLFLGHGHARQTDGSVTGTGVETSLDVEFTVDVVKKKAWPHSSVVRQSTVVGEFEMQWPRIESSEYLMTVGGGTTLLEAVQHATLELHHWLDDDFGLSERAVNIFVGQAIEYDIASIEAASFSVAAKVRKAYLPRAAAP